MNISNFIHPSATIAKDVPPYAIVGGVPAKIIKYRFNATIITKLLELEWWNVPMEYLKDIQFDDIERAIEDCTKAKRLYEKSLL